ncbi:hypothetical protein NP493_12g01001 [Ridgeia piscesae]|uniref:Solute carrier family 13 member 5 n=1 Tax=Ridgeia piscesae TaxID=27915 RepID=A0AAD9PET0_RIDPI|nr:hypothetical protein NP493_12g01001 [Ridgeia piscesae]
MAVFWMTETIPMAVTALLPVVIMPWLGVIGSKTLCKNYLKDTNMLFLGGLLVAVAVEKCNLHRRIALRVLSMVGSKPKWLMMGFMMVTAFLSMWISNTATTAMMIPIVHAILVQLRDNREIVYDDVEDGTNGMELGMCQDNFKEEMSSPDEENMIQNHVTHADDTDNARCNGHSAYLRKRRRRMSTKSEAKFVYMSKALRLSVCFSANIGGTATLTGTAPNLVFKGIVDTLYGGGTGITFSSWFVFAFPNMLIMLVMAWAWLVILYMGVSEFWSTNTEVENERTKAAAAVISDEYQKIGPLSFAEKAVAGHFIILALLWLTRDPQVIPGWSDFLGEETKTMVTDASVGITIAALLFMFPSRRPNFLCFRSKDDDSEPCPAPALLDWQTVHQKMQWNVLLILGGGFALAESCKESGLSTLIGQMLSVFGSLPSYLIVLVLCLITSAFTQVTTNTGTITIFLPILAEMAATLQMNPLYLMVPTTLASSFAFMLPVATPPNTIVFAYGNLRIMDMIISGAVMNILCLVVLQICVNTWTYAYLGLGVYPSWAPNSHANISTTAFPHAAGTLNVTLMPYSN